MNDLAVLDTQTPAGPSARPDLIGREVGLLRDLARLQVERSEAEARTSVEFGKADSAAERTSKAAREQLARHRAAEDAAARDEHGKAVQEATSRIVAARNEALAAFDRARTTLDREIERAREDVARENDELRWKSDATFEGAADRAQRQLDTFARAYEDEEAVVGPLIGEGHYLLGRYQKWSARGDAPPPDVPLPAIDPEQPLATCATARADLERTILKFRHLGLAKFAREGGAIFLTILLTLVGLVAGGVAWNWAIGAPALAGLGLVVGGLLFGLFDRVGRRKVAPLYDELARVLAVAEAIGPRAVEQQQALAKQVEADARARHKEDSREADLRHERATARIDETHGQALAVATRKRDEALAILVPERDAALNSAEARLQKRLAALTAHVDATGAEIESTYKAQKAAAVRRRDEAWAALESAWRRGMTLVLDDIAFVNDACARFFPDTDRAEPAALPVPAAVPPAMRFGEFAVDRSALPGGLPTDERLQVGPAAFALPALMPFPERSSLLIKASGDGGRERAAEVMQATMLRMLASLPPSKVRFTIIDPVGLGRHFAAFMHLADFDEKLVSSRIWSEPPHIERELTDLTEHMENVIQKYLRNEYETIEDYNAMAGEVAEPYQVLVVADFPANFNDNAARRLASIAASGIRCGVLTLIHADAKQPMPAGFDLKELERDATQLVWKQGQMAWKDPELGTYPLTLDRPPDNDRFTRILQVLGARARDAGKVEVPFEVIAPPAEKYWTADSRPGIDVPLGRAGATRLQHMALGQGTSQHVLVAGRTGSGKSTLLHALITNIALRYSPEEIELYLIDFKKGVEFKTYATHHLPHARVVAVESEREFGLSVLQRLDHELKVRGDRFREVNAQNVASYRNATGKPCPRIMLIVDEFQEFFVEDDKVAQEATLLFDRLVRQGRAFGIHVHLGSQTLGGSFSLARTTLSQMGVRIALQCSESDANLILSEENSAARLLSRPGEAIYNDANGLIEGNHPFQVVWLSDSKREHYLKTLQTLDRERNGDVLRPMIVFEGMAPADLGNNPQLETMLREPSWPAETPAPKAWLGEAIAIKDPTAAVFRRQGGANVLVVGQQEDAAAGMFAAAIAGLAAQHAPGWATFYVLDGTPADSPRVGSFARVAGALPHDVRVVGVREAGNVVREIAANLERRQSHDDPTNVYLLIFDGQRFRDLRKAEDDYGFGSSDEPPSPSKQLATILREGPTLGIHTLAWIDSLNNVNRVFDRQSLREFEMRVMFQMSANDSSTLIDSPAAGRLGPHRALYNSEEQGLLEKFRPYNLPSDAELDRLRAAFADRPRPEPPTPPPAPEPSPEPSPSFNDPEPMPSFDEPEPPSWGSPSEGEEFQP